MQDHLKRIVECEMGLFARAMLLVVMAAATVPAHLQGQAVGLNPAWQPTLAEGELVLGFDQDTNDSSQTVVESARTGFTIGALIGVGLSVMYGNSTQGAFNILLSGMLFGAVGAAIGAAVGLST